MAILGEKFLRVTDHVRLYVIVKALGDELCRRYGTKAIVVAEVSFNYGQCVVNMSARLEGSQALRNFRDPNSAPYVEEVVSVFVLSPVPEGKGLEDSKGAWTAHRNAPGSRCTGKSVGGQLFLVLVFEGQF